ncbi:MAG: FAD-dependent oxidoreductase [Chloroflexi bacterium]|nr:MAG: FAD-dependent oxidoreductase [Chloroflexota bacterium]
MSTHKQSIIIVGGGIYGATAALSLRRRGHDVALFDPGPLPHPDASSTDISKMIRMDYGADEFYMELMEACFPVWREWNQIWGEDLYHEVGFLIMTPTLMQPGGYEYESWRLLQKHGHSVDRIDATTLRERFPAWNADYYIDGYYNPTGGWAESGAVVARLLAMGRAAGVQLHEGKTFAQLIETDNRVTGIVTAGGEQHQADWVVVAAGAWTPTLLPYLSEVMWAVGQPVVHFKPENPDDYRPPKFMPWSADISRTGWYGFPLNKDGILKVGHHAVGRRVHPAEPREVLDEEIDRARQFLRHTFSPAGDSPVVGTRLCLYCDTWDGNFWIDRDPQRPGLIVSTGGSGHGFKFAPQLGEIVADVLEGRPNRFAERFAWRERRDLLHEDARYMAD